MRGRYQAVFLGAWVDILDEEHTEAVFRRIESRLDEIAQKENGLKLTVPFVCFDCRKD
ncbi:MAG TPA: hypothetical protein PLZ84_06325 [Clostridia bacterium]|nr:hypothetical protein [Clostridia bacterium]